MKPPMWIDISVPVAPGITPTWPDSPAVTFDKRLSIERGEDVDDTTMRCSVHTGTHLDAPAHHLPGGTTVDAIPLEVLIGPCYVADLGDAPKLTAAVLEGAQIPASAARLLLKTSNSQRWAPDFDRSFVGLSPDGAQWVASRAVQLLGIDYLSVQPLDESNEVHRTLMHKDITILEGADLSGVDPGWYELYCLPMRLIGTEGAPVRALLRPMEAQ